MRAAPMSQQPEIAPGAVRARRPPGMGGTTRQTAYPGNPGLRFDKAEQRSESPRSVEGPRRRVSAREGVRILVISLGIWQAVRARPLRDGTT